MRKQGRSRKKKSTWFLNILIVFFLGVMVFCGYQIVSQLIKDRHGEQVYEQLASQAVSEETETAVVEKEDGEQEVISLRQIDFEALWEQNTDVVAWLECEGTVVDYPVVQGEDNDYYLRRLLDGSYHRFGTLFVDYQNASDFSDQNTVIYGHNIKAGDMFHVLNNYKDPDYYPDHPYFMLYLPDATYRLELFAGTLVDGADGIPLNFATEEAFQAYIDSLRAESTFESPVEMTSADRMVTLYTCAYDFDTARYVVCGKLVEVSASGETGTEEAGSEGRAAAE